MTSALEHNSVLRPLGWLAGDLGIRPEFVPCGCEGGVGDDRRREAVEREVTLIEATGLFLAGIGEEGGGRRRP